MNPTSKYLLNKNTNEKILSVIMLLTIFISNQFGQELKRDTTIFKEHQLVFEHMDYVPTKQIVSISRKLNNDSVTLRVACDPYWISSLVSNKEHRDYINSIMKDSINANYQKALINKNLLNQKISALSITLKEYYNNPTYDFYPVLGLSWLQAQAFCDWKTKKVNEELNEVNLPQEKIYRIPSQAEIELTKRFADINKPGIYKVDTTYTNDELVSMNSSIKEWTGEGYIESKYFTELIDAEQSNNVILYDKKGSSNNVFHNKDIGNIDIGFRFAQTYRKVKNSK